MLELKTRQQIRFVTVEKSTAYFVFAFLVENQNGREVIVSEPKVIKVIQKKVVASLPAPVCKKCAEFVSVESPYVEFFHTKETQNFSLFARPPTV